MNPASVDIKDMLVSDGMGVPASSFFIASEPDDPHKCVTIYDTGGGDANPKWRLDEPSVQIRSRAKKYSSAYATLMSIRAKLLGRDSETKNGTVYDGIWVEGDVVPLQRDSKGRSILVLNFRMSRRPSDADHRSDLA